MKKNALYDRRNRLDLLALTNPDKKAWGQWRYKVLPEQMVSW